MISLFYHLLFLVFSLYISIQSISYGIYEIHEQNNKIGGRIVILFTIFSVIFSNILVWQN